MYVSVAVVWRDYSHDTMCCTLSCLNVSEYLNIHVVQTNKYGFVEINFLIVFNCLELL